MHDGHATNKKTEGQNNVEEKMGRVEDTAKTPRNGKGFDPFGLAIYGSSLLSKNVRSWITVFTVALIIVVGFVKTGKMEK